MSRPCRTLGWFHLDILKVHQTSVDSCSNHTCTLPDSEYDYHFNRKYFPSLSYIRAMLFSSCRFSLCVLTINLALHETKIPGRTNLNTFLNWKFIFYSLERDQDLLLLGLFFGHTLQSMERKVKNIYSVTSLKNHTVNIRIQIVTQSKSDCSALYFDNHHFPSIVFWPSPPQTEDPAKRMVRNTGEVRQDDIRYIRGWKVIFMKKSGYLILLTLGWEMWPGRSHGGDWLLAVVRMFRC